MSLSADKVVAASNAWVVDPRQRHDRSDRRSTCSSASPTTSTTRSSCCRFTPSEAVRGRAGGRRGHGARPGAPVRPPRPVLVGQAGQPARGRGPAPRARRDGRRDAGRARGRPAPGPARAAAAGQRTWTLRWATEVATHRDGTQVGVTVFGGSMPPEERLAQEAKRDGATVKAGDGGMVVAYVDDAAVGSGGLAMADGVARLWGGAVLESARGQGVYRALLGARLKYGVGPRRHDGPGQGPRRQPPARSCARPASPSYGQEISYRVPLT